MRRSTLAEPARLSGLAVRTHGGPAQVTIEPGADGFAFWRDDLGVRLPADLDHLVEVPNCTALGRGRPEVLFVEHVLAALVGLGYSDAEIHLDGPEIPLLDGSAAPIVAALHEAGRRLLPDEIEPLTLLEPVGFEADGQSLQAHPAASWSVEYTFVHPHPRIAFDRATFDASCDFATAIAPARTFATEQELRALAEAGLIAGGSAENLLVVHDDRLSAPLRLEHEFATHKVLDLIGDLALLGRPVQARLVAHRTGHSDNHALARLLRAAAG